MKLRRLTSNGLAEVLDAVKHVRNSAGIGSLGVFFENLQVVALGAALVFLTFSLLSLTIVRLQEARQRDVESKNALRAARDAQRRRMIARRLDRRRGGIACRRERD